MFQLNCSIGSLQDFTPHVYSVISTGICTTLHQKQVWLTGIEYKEENGILKKGSEKRCESIEHSQIGGGCVKVETDRKQQDSNLQCFKVGFILRLCSQADGLMDTLNPGSVCVCL